MGADAGQRQIGHSKASTFSLIFFFLRNFLCQQHLPDLVVQQGCELCFKVNTLRGGVRARHYYTTKGTVQRPNHGCTRDNYRTIMMDRKKSLSKKHLLEEFLEFSVGNPK